MVLKNNTSFDHCEEKRKCQQDQEEKKNTKAKVVFVQD